MDRLEKVHEKIRRKVRHRRRRVDDVFKLLSSVSPQMSALRKGSVLCKRRRHFKSKLSMRAAFHQDMVERDVPLGKLLEWQIR